VRKRILLGAGVIVLVVLGALIFRDRSLRRSFGRLIGLGGPPTAEKGDAPYRRPGCPDDAAEVPPERILLLLGASGRSGGTAEKIRSYRRIFARLDADDDGRHSREEFVEKGSYLNARARAGIFAAADNDGDGFVTEAEYVENRIITDEAKAIVTKMDLDGDGRVTSVEFVERSGIDDPALAARIYRLLDTDGNDEIRPPEYLRVWGRWARAGKGEDVNGADPDREAR